MIQLNKLKVGMKLISLKNYVHLRQKDEVVTVIELNPHGGNLFLYKNSRGDTSGSNKLNEFNYYNVFKLPSWL